MNGSRYVTPAEMDGFLRRLREYSRTYPDSDFLDNSLAYAESGRLFTRENAAKVSDALISWETRLNAPSYDPDRPPPGCDEHIWKLATVFRSRMEASGWRCPSRRVICAELGRAIARDNLRENHAPWQDKDGVPGWYRMLADVIAWYTGYEVTEQGSWYAHQDLAQPGTISRITGLLKEHAKDRLFAGRARPSSMGTPSPQRRQQVRDFLAARRARGD